ncbi:MAG: hypothetical protein HY721_14230 [Planctomycetes bacterium]|nr:hypothetical protein [Planctomycetota bacterium]
MARTPSRLLIAAIAPPLVAIAAAAAGGCGATAPRAPDPPAAGQAPPPAAQDPPPAAGLPAARAEDAARAELKALLARMGVQYFPAERKVEVAGWVNMQKGLVEVFACAPGGKTHEAVVVLDCVPSGLQAGLLALGLKPGKPVEGGTEANYKPPSGDPVDVSLRWRSADGEEKTARAEDWVWNQRDERAMDRAPWVFAGSFMQSTGASPLDATFAANYVKSLVTTYHDASSILENPSRDGIDDTLYFANEQSVPPAGTPVTVVFTPAVR